MLAINQLMDEICTNWTNLKNDIIKGLITKKLSVIRKVGEKILHIAALERSINNKLINMDDEAMILP